MSETELIGTIYSQLLEEFGFDYCEKDLWMLAENLAERIVNAQPTLNENQQIVLKEIKDISQECDYNLLGIIWVLGQRAKHDTDISRFTNNEILQVLQAFSACALEQEEE